MQQPIKVLRLFIMQLRRSRRSCKALTWQTDVLVNVVARNGSTPLHRAALYGHIDLVELLLNRPDIKINVADSNSITPLHFAVLKGTRKLLNFYLQDLTLR